MDNKSSSCDTDKESVKLEDTAIDILIREDNLKPDKKDEISSIVNKFLKPYNSKYKEIYKKYGKYKTFLTDMRNAKFGSA